MISNYIHYFNPLNNIMNICKLIKEGKEERDMGREKKRGMEDHTLLMMILIIVANLMTSSCANIFSSEYISCVQVNFLSSLPSPLSSLSPPSSLLAPPSSPLFYLPSVAHTSIGDAHVSITSPFKISSLVLGFLPSSSRNCQNFSFCP